MRRVCMALALVAVIPLSAGAEPITVSLQSGSGAEYADTATTTGFAVDIGELALSGPGSTAVFYVDELKANTDYTINLSVTNPDGLSDLRFEVLDPLDNDDWADPTRPSTDIPTGYSTSNRFDGFSFAQESGLTRSATFVGGSVAAVADEKTHRADLLLFSGLDGAEEARVTFGLRDYWGQRGFLVRVTALGGGNASDAAHTPEPASMLLLGTGIAGLAGVYRRRRQSPQA
jgi:PEP-CTERM motif